MATNNAPSCFPPNFRPTRLWLQPSPDECYIEAVNEHRQRLKNKHHKSWLKIGSLVKNNSDKAFSARPPTPSGNYRPISFGLHRQTLPVGADVDGEGGLPLLCDACQARETEVETTPLPAALQTRRVRFVDPKNTCATCARFLIRPCGAKDADMETLVGSDFGEDEDEGEDDDDTKPQAIYLAVAATYPPNPNMENYEEICENATSFNIDVGSLVAQRAEEDYHNSILEAGRWRMSGFTLIPTSLNS